MSSSGKSPPSALAAALDYLARGWSVIPLCPADHEGCSAEHVANCQAPGRQPLIPWKEYQTRLPRESELKLYWTRYPTARVGLVLGRVSRLAAVETTGPEAPDLLAEVFSRALPATLQLPAFGGGRLFCYAIRPTLFVPSRRFERNQSHVLVLGEGTYAVLDLQAGSGRSLTDVPADLPAWFLDEEPLKENQPVAVSSVRLSSLKPAPLEWLWPGWLPLGKLCDLSGDPGLSKSTLLLDLAARITTHGVMPDGSQGPAAAGVGIMSAEDGLEDTILPRFRAAGGDLTRAGFFSEYQRRPLVIPDHLDRIEARLRDYDARLLLIDPLVAYLARARSDQDVRKGLHPLKLMAERLRCTVLWLRHLNKSASSRALYRGSGFMAIIGAARSGLLVGQDPSAPERRVLAHVKSNLAPPQTSLAYSVSYVAEQAATRLTWIGPCALDADDLVQAHSGQDREARAEAQAKLTEAREFLTQALKDGPRVVADLRDEARVLGLAWPTVRRARQQMGARTDYPHQTASGRHEWVLVDRG